MKFNIGDVVQLNSGGPLMTIEEKVESSRVSAIFFLPITNDNTLGCETLYKKNCEEVIFHEDTLHLISSVENFFPRSARSEVTIFSSGSEIKIDRFTMTNSEASQVKWECDLP